MLEPKAPFFRGPGNGSDNLLALVPGMMTNCSGPSVGLDVSRCFVLRAVRHSHTACCRYDCFPSRVTLRLRSSYVPRIAQLRKTREDVDVNAVQNPFLSHEYTFIKRPKKTREFIKTLKIGSCVTSSEWTGIQIGSA